MKNYYKMLLFLQFLFFCSLTEAQTTDFTIGIIMPDASGEITQSNILKIENKIAQIINNSNEAIIGYSNDFVVYPVVTMDDISVAEGGMQNITVATIDFSLYVKQVSSNLVYNTISRKLKGSGSNKAQAIANALNQIKANDDAYLQFIKVAKSKILKYYSDNCKSLIQKAENLSSKQEYEQALGILQAIPSNIANCYSEAQNKSIDIYKKYQTVLCTKNVNKAKAEIAVNNYAAALEALEMIDPTSNCASEVKKMIAQISSKVDKKDQQEYDLTKLRINAIKEIGKAYYANTIRLVSYNVIVR